MTGEPPGKKGIPCPETLVPVLAFGSTLAGMALWNAGILPDIRFAAIGGFLASCLLAYLAWNRLHKDIVALSTPIYGFIFLITPIDYTGGVLLQLVYAAGLTILAARLRYRFGAGITSAPPAKDLTPGPLLTYVESTRDPLSSLAPACGHAAADVFLRFSEGEYGKAAELAHAALCQDGTPGPVVRAFSVLRQQAELLDRDQPRPLTYEKFLPADALLLAKHLPGSGDPEREYEMMMDAALLLLFSAGWHASPKDQPSLLISQGFARKLMEE